MNAQCLLALVLLAAACDAAINDGAQVPLECKLQPEVGPCISDSDIPSYYYDVGLSICTPFEYGGCEGNDNRFETMEDCMAMCMGGAELVGEDGDESAVTTGAPQYDETPAPTTTEEVTTAPRVCVEEIMQGYQLVENVNYKTVIASSASACATFCDDDVSCKSAHFFTFKKPTTNCMLNSANDFDEYPESLRELPEQLIDRVAYYRACK